MARALAALLAVGLLATSCGGDSDDADDTAMFCPNVVTASDSLDELSRTLLAALSGSPADELMVAIDATATAMDDMRATAPDDLADEADLLADSYADFRELLEEIEFDMASLPADDPRADAIRDQTLSEALAAVNAHCRSTSEEAT